MQLRNIGRQTKCVVCPTDPTVGTATVLLTFPHHGHVVQYRNDIDDNG